jgi:hypothetical protein
MTKYRVIDINISIFFGDCNLNAFQNGYTPKGTRLIAHIEVSVYRTQELKGWNGSSIHDFGLDYGDAREETARRRRSLHNMETVEIHIARVIFFLIFPLHSQPFMPLGFVTNVTAYFQHYGPLVFLCLQCRRWSDRIQTGLTYISALGDDACVVPKCRVLCRAQNTTFLTLSKRPINFRLVTLTADTRVALACTKREESECKNVRRVRTCDGIVPTHERFFWKVLRER